MPACSERLLSCDRLVFGFSEIMLRSSVDACESVAAGFDGALDLM
jgi:hypothetical protein